MQKYHVMVHGQNLWTEIEGVRHRMGFYTNVFVEAFTAADAEARALDLIRDDEHLQDTVLNAEGDPLLLSSEEVRELESFDGLRLPRSGFALYRHEEGVGQ